jgi:sulfonate transport system substrate-binding protein
MTSAAKSPLFSRRAMIGTALAALAGCGTRPADGPAQVVRIASIGFFEGGQLRIGGNQTSVIHTKGWLGEALARRGVRLEWTPISSALGGPGFNEALANRTVDFAAYGDLPAIIARAGGIPIKLVVPAGRGTNSYLVVPRDSPARSVTDLRGKSIAVQRGRPPELAFSQLIASAGLSHEDFRIYNVNSTAGAAALAAGRVDAAFAGPDAYLLEDRGVGRILWSSKGTNWKWRAELFVREEFAARNPELVQEVVDNYVRAARWSAEEAHRDEAQRLISRSGTPLSVVQRDADGDGAWRDRWSPLFDDYMRQHYADAVRFTAEQGLIRRAFDVDEFFDPSYVGRALQKLDLAGYWAARPAVAQAAGR